MDSLTNSALAMALNHSTTDELITLRKENARLKQENDNFRSNLKHLEHHNRAISNIASEIDGNVENLRDGLSYNQLYRENHVDEWYKSCYVSTCLSNETEIFDEIKYLLGNNKIKSDTCENFAESYDTTQSLIYWYLNHNASPEAMKYLTRKLNALTIYCNNEYRHNDQYFLQDIDVILKPKYTSILNPTFVLSLNSTLKYIALLDEWKEHGFIPDLKPRCCMKNSDLENENQNDHIYIEHREYWYINEPDFDFKSYVIDLCAFYDSKTKLSNYETRNLNEIKSWLSVQ